MAEEKEKAMEKAQDAKVPPPNDKDALSDRDAEKVAGGGGKDILQDWITVLSYEKTHNK